jgi:putative ABC transport system ATP-binding protein
MTAESSTMTFEADSICKYFRRGSTEEVRALEGITLQVSRGSFCVLRGHSGSGKTTLLAILGALETPTSGRLLVGGRDLTGLSDVELARVRRRMGFVFQTFSLIRRLPAWENVTYPLIPRGVSRAERYKIAQQLLARLHLPHRLTADSETLSAGEQQRVTMARALAGRPEVLLADEPTSSLDPACSDSVVALLQELHAAGTTLIVASHDPQIVSIATDVVELESGSLKSKLDRRTVREVHR